MDSESFFHPDRERGPGRAQREESAIEVCRGCPVIEDCRRHALDVEEPYGVWGGLTETERRDIVVRSRDAGRRRLAAALFGPPHRA